MSYLTDGFSTTVDFADFPSVQFKEREVTPPGLDGGGENDTSHMRLIRWRTRQPKKLLTMTEFSETVFYDPIVYDDGQIVDMMQVNQLCTVNFSDGSSVDFWGWLDKFIPGAASEGTAPTADVTIIPSNQNNGFVEVAPVYHAP